MPLENVILIPIKCPNCGADLEVPDSLDTAQCTFCGSKFFISELRTTARQGSIGVIENYIKLVILAMSQGNQTQAEQYFDKAKEVSAFSPC